MSNLLLMLFNSLLRGKWLNYFPETVKYNALLGGPELDFSLTEIDSRSKKTRLLSKIFLMCTTCLSYNACNTVTTPLHNAQPWWLFYACDLRKVTGGGDA